MSRFLEVNIKRITNQEQNLAAHKWAKLAETDNRWSVYPNQPNRMYVFPLWNPQWKNQGK